MATRASGRIASGPEETAAISFRLYSLDRVQPWELSTNLASTSPAITQTMWSITSLQPETPSASESPGMYSVEDQTIRRWPLGGPYSTPWSALRARLWGASTSPVCLSLQCCLCPGQNLFDGILTDLWSGSTGCGSGYRSARSSSIWKSQW